MRNEARLARQKRKLVNGDSSDEVANSDTLNYKGSEMGSPGGLPLPKV